MKTTIEVTFKVQVVSETHLDENSIKSAINDTQDVLTSTSSEIQDISDYNVNSVSVTLSKLKIDNKLIDLGAFGTPELPWN